MALVAANKAVHSYRTGTMATHTLHAEIIYSLSSGKKVECIFNCLVYVYNLCYHCHSSTALSYVTDMLHIKPLHTRNTRSSSYTMPLLNRTAHSKATLGDRSFSFASSSV